MSTHMKAPEGVTAISVGNDQYNVDETGHITVDNGEHLPILAQHGFELVAGEVTTSEPEPEVVITFKPEFAKMNKDSIVNWLRDHGCEEGDATLPKATLVQVAEDHHASLQSSDGAGEAAAEPGAGDDSSESTSGSSGDDTTEGAAGTDSVEGQSGDTTVEGDAAQDAAE